MKVILKNTSMVFQSAIPLAVTTALTGRYIKTTGVETTDSYYGVWKIKANSSIQVSGSAYTGGYAAQPQRDLALYVIKRNGSVVSSQIATSTGSSTQTESYSVTLQSGDELYLNDRSNCDPEAVHHTSISVEAVVN